MVGHGVERVSVEFINERYGYKDQARPGVTPPWPSSPYYDLKALRWWVRARKTVEGTNLFWNIG
jgi:hypothetical protein